jgi:hypothetical protein
MTPIRRPDDVDRVAARIVEDSFVAQAFDTARHTIAAAVDSSTSANRGRQLAERWQRLTPPARLRCLMTMSAVALGGHLVMAPMLPWPARPNVLLAAGVLGLVMLAAAAAMIRPRS